MSKYYTLTRNTAKCHVFEFDPNELRLDATIGTRYKLERLSTINGEPKADEYPYAKLNGGFFQMNGSTEHLGTFIDEGLYYNAPAWGYPTLIYWKANNRMTIEKDVPTERLNIIQRDAWWAIGVPWALVIDGKQNYLYDKATLIQLYSHPWTRAARTLMGQKKDGTIVWVVVECNWASLGFTIEHSSALMLELGCDIAVNLDGGGSSEMIVDGKIKNSLASERAIGTAFMAYAKRGANGTVTPATDVQTTPVNKPANPQAATGTVTASALWLRTGPSTSYNGLTTMPNGTKLTLEDSANGWYKVTYKGLTGWCSGTYIKVS